MKKEYYITFAQSSPHRDKYATVVASTYQEARSMAFDIYGQRWSFLYETKEDAGVEQFNLTEL